MKTFYSFLFLLILFGSSIYSQNYSWFQPTNYPSGGLSDLSFINENTGWVIHSLGAVYRTTDAGISWELIDSIPSSPGFRSVVFINESTGWIGSLNINNVLYKTTNGGYNWTVVTNLPNPVPRGICGIHALNNNFIYGCGTWGSSANFIKSTDGGNNWITKDMTMYATGLVDCYFFDEHKGIAVGGEGVFSTRKSKILLTTDGGETWEVKFTGTRNSEWCWKIYFVDENIGFVSLETDVPVKYFVKTTDGGMTWNDLPFPNANEQGIGFINSNTGWIGGKTQTGYGTTDGGSSWFNANIGLDINRFQMFGDTLGYACGRYVFKYAKTSGIAPVNSVIPENFYLLQNYPNPYNSSTKIRFGISKKSNVKINVYDNLGKNILTILNEPLAPGNYETSINTGALSSGVYYYSLESDYAREVRKMIILK